MSDLLTLTQPLTGCLVSAQGTPDMTVAVAVGSVLVGNAAVTVAAGNVTITAAAAAGDRIDAVVADSTGAKSVIAGAVNDGANAQPPDTTGYALLAYVYVVNQASTQYTGTITADAITDKREFALIHTSPYRVTGLWYATPGGQSNRNAWTNNDCFFLPFFTAKTLSIQALALNLLSAGNAGCVGRLGIYADDGAGTLAILVDAGTVALTGAAGARSIATSQTLTPGWWWLAGALQGIVGAAPTLATVIPVSSPVGAAAPTQVIGYGALLLTGISGALPASPSGFDYSRTSLPVVWIQAS